MDKEEIYPQSSEEISDEDLWPHYSVEAEWTYLPSGDELREKTGSESMNLYLREMWAKGANNNEKFVVTRRLNDLAIELKARGKTYVLDLNSMIIELLDKLVEEFEASEEVVDDG